MERDITHDGSGGARTADPIVRLVDVEKRFGPQQVLRGLTLDVRRGATTVVLGPSGCGKSVMLKHVIGLLRPDAGSVWFDGERVDTRSERELGVIRRSFGFLFQGGALFDSMNVERNVAFPLTEHERLSAAACRERVHEVLALVGLPDVGRKMPAELSGGQRKRVALARAIVLRPTVILYDEPTTGLDPIRSNVINDLILRLQDELGATSIVVTHDLVSAFRVADDMVLLHEGRVVHRATPERFRTSSDPHVQQFLRGEAEPRSVPELEITPFALARHGAVNAGSRAGGVG